MDISQDLIKTFADVTGGPEPIKPDTNYYGTAVVSDRLYVIFDGATVQTPVISAVAVNNGDRVLVLMKNHSPIITGNLSSQVGRGDPLRFITLWTGSWNPATQGPLGPIPNSTRFSFFMLNLGGIASWGFNFNGVIRASGMDVYPGGHYTIGAILSLSSGNIWSGLPAYGCNYLYHSPSSGHGTITQTLVNGIYGVAI